MKELSSIGFLLALVAIISVGFVVSSTFKSTPVVNEPKPFCAVIDHNFGAVREGKNLFIKNCASCHAKNMKTHGAGPALGESIDRWKKDTVQFMNYLNDSERFFNSVEDQRLIELRKEFGFVISHKYSLSLEEVKELIAYIEN